MPEKNTEPVVYEDEMSLGELILNIKDYALYVLKYWLIIGIVGVMFAALFAVYTLMQPTKYEADISFVVTDAKGSSVGSSIASALSNFGIAAPSQDGINYYKIVNLAKSARIHSQALLDSVVIDGEKELLGNQIIKIYNLDGRWEKITDYHLSSDSLHQLNLDERKLLKKLITIVAGTEESDNQLFNISFSEESYVIECSVVTIDEDLSEVLVEHIYNHISQFYITQAISQAQLTVELYETRKDSIEGALKAKEMSLASIQDASRGILYNQYEIAEANLSREKTLITTMYFEVVKNLEAAKFNLSNIRPFFTPIDMPFKPLEKVEASWLKRGVIGGFIGCFLAVLFIVLRRYFKEAIEAADEG